MKTLILTCNTGGGHNSSSAAIKQAYDNIGVACDVVDALSLISAKMSRFIGTWHARIYRHVPKAFSEGYSFLQSRNAETGKTNANAIVLKAIGTGAYKLSKMIEREGYDHVLCTHVISAVMMTGVIKRYGRNVSTSFVDTDYTCPPLLVDCDVDIFFTPHEDLTEEFVACGIPSDRIVPVGIPVSNSYRESISKEFAKMRLGINPENRNILLMGGSMGCGPVGDMVPSILESLEDDCILSVVCGTNKKLFSALAKNHFSKLHLYEFTDKIPTLMDSAELLITKPGGISISEAATKALPLMLMDVVGGCETRNMNFFLKNDWAKKTTPETAGEDCAKFLADEKELLRCRQSLALSFERDVAMDICSCSMSRLSK